LETHAHQHLKHLAAAYLRSIGCMAVAMEVRCPIARYRIDVAGHLDTDPLEFVRCDPRSVVVECKQSRSDFLRDRTQMDRLIRIRDHLERVRGSIEEHRIKAEEPHLRVQGSSLFESMDDWNFAESRLPSYRRTLRRLRRVDQKLYGETKFFLMSRYRLADRMYIAAPRGMIRPCELPRGWGLLECPAECLEPLGESDRFTERPQLSVRLESREHGTHPERRLRWLRNIAVAASMAALGGRTPVDAAADDVRRISAKDFSRQPAG
jgi:hypothetical protein